MKFKKSYLIGLALLLILTAGSGVQGQSIYLDPDAQYITTGIATEFEFELRVDAGIVSLKSFVYHLDFNPAKLGVVSVVQGPLLPSSPAGVSGTMFGSYVIDDRLEVEDLILGAGIDVAGPGVIATITFVVIDTGTINLAVSHHRLRDVAGTLLTTDAYGAMVYINVPPEPFDLISPVQGQVVDGLPGDNFDLMWSASQTPYPGESINYSVEYGTSASFDPGQTTTITDLPDTWYTIQIDDLIAVHGGEGTYYWRVAAIGDVNGYERLSNPESQDFQFEYSAIAPEPFNLVGPILGQLVEGLPGESFDLTWVASSSLRPDESVEYSVEYGTSATFDPGQTTTVMGLTNHWNTIQFDDIIALYGSGGTCYWRVTAVGTVDGLETLCTPSSENYQFQYVHVAPDQFDLISPVAGQLVEGLPGETFELTWTSSSTIYPGVSVEYAVEYGTSATFDPGQTTTVAGLTDTWHTIQIDDLTAVHGGEGTYYWRVAAVGLYGMMRLSTPDSEDFQFRYTHVAPDPFSLVSPVQGQTVIGLGGDDFDLVWTASQSLFPGEVIEYTVEYGTSDTFDPGHTTTVPGLTDAWYTVQVNDLITIYGGEGIYYWRVTASGDVNGLERQSTPFLEEFDFQYGQLIGPDPFDLLSPVGGQTVEGLPGGTFDLTWAASQSGQVGEAITYSVEYGTSPTFDPPQTTIVAGISDAWHAIQVDDLIAIHGGEGTYYWRVTAIGVLYGLETLSTPGIENYQFQWERVPPEAFDLLSPANGVELTGIMEIPFDWQDATSVIPGDEIAEYVLYVGTNPAVPTGALVAETVSASEALISVSGLPRNQSLYWTVSAENTYGGIGWPTSEFMFALPGCCLGRVGDANSVGGDEPTIGDVSVMIDSKFITGDCDGIIVCLAEADINRSGGSDPTCVDITIGDISILIDYLFITGVTLGLSPCQ